MFLRMGVRDYLQAKQLAFPNQHTVLANFGQGRCGLSGGKVWLVFFRVCDTLLVMSGAAPGVGRVVEFLDEFDRRRMLDAPAESRLV